MGKFLSQIFPPLLLLGAASLNWSLISLGDLVVSILLQLKAPTTGLYCRKRSLIFWSVVIFSALAVISNAIFQIILAVEGAQWKMMDTHWEKLLGLTRDQEFLSPSIMYLLVVQPLIALVALYEIYSNGNRSDRTRDTCLARLASAFTIDLNLKGLSCLILPAVELVVGISHPSWASLPFLICSCIGLVKWSLTSNILSFFWGWKYLLSYAGFNIVLLYIYQLPVEFFFIFQWLADFIGLFKINTKSTWSETCSGVSLVFFHFMLSRIRLYLLEKEIVSATENGLMEQLLPSKDSSDMIHSSLLWRGSFSWTISVNFFTFGLPISLLVISFWTFHFASICALGLLAYAGYILHTFPSLFRLHQLNCVLLAFILFWAASTYIFNVAFILLDNELQKDMDLWESIGLWHYSVPGVYILAQICLAAFVAIGNLANRSILQYLSDVDSQSTYDHGSVEESEEPGSLIVATVAWALRKTSRAILLWLILSIALTPGYIPSLYILFFLIYLLSHTISRRMHQSLIYLCEIHFVLKYVLQLKLLYKVFEREGSLAFQILSDFGLHDHSSFMDFAKIGGLACICAAYKNGPDVILTFSTILQQVPFSPSGWSLLKAGLNKSVLLAVYKANSSDAQFSNSSQARSIASYLSAMDYKLLSAYRSCGTYTVAATILVMVYLMTPNYSSFGYLFFLLQWMVGRQLLEKTRTRLWFPLKVYAVLIFLLLYGLSAFISFRKWLSITIDLYPAFGFDPRASIFSNIWKYLIILIVMQLYSYERKENKISGAALKNISFLRRFLMWHCEKLLFLVLLYASLSPISAVGFLYILGLVICSALPKSSRLPSKFFISYSAFLLMADYLFQIWGGISEMFPGQKNFYISRFIGLSLFSPGFLGLESGLRGNVLVIIACLLQYNVFRWLEKTRNYKKRGKWEEPCALFGHEIEETDGFFFPTESSSRWGGSEGNYNWSKKLNQIMRREKLEMQKTTLKIYIKYWMDNIFNVAGLEINMITLLLASFAVLNAISLLYVSLLAVCVLLPRHILKKLWPIFVFVFSSVVTLEYMALWLNLTLWEEQSQEKATINCHDCWRSSEFFPVYCKKCWLGIIVDDPRIIISYYLVLMVSCFKLRADYLSSVSKSHNYWKMRYQWKKASLLGDLSFETKNMWTVLDYLRHYSYCHLLNLVLALILITGTLEYDILHLGYLGFAMVFFRLRLQILKKKNAIFKYLQMYNFGLIVLSLAYQSPFIGDVTEGKCDFIDYIYEVIGFHKYDYGFQITSRSALVEIVIFSLVSLQSYMFSSAEFDYVSKYLEAELIDALVHEKEKKAAWKIAQLQHIRQSEEKKRLQNLQVENMKSEVLSLQIQLHSMTNTVMFGNISPEGEGCRRRENCSLSSVKESSASDKEERDTKKTELPSMVRSSSPVANNSMINSIDSFYGVSNFDMSREEISSLYIRGEANIGSKRKLLASTIRLFGDGVSQAKSLGRFAVDNLAKILDIKKGEVDSGDDSSDDGEYYEVEDQNVATEPLGQTSSVHSGFERTMSDIPRLRTGTIFRYMWVKMRLNNDIVCYCCFVLIFLWNFSLLSMVYLAALFLYALCANGGPSNMFWVIILMYTEFCILIQYIYQIVIQHCGVTIQLDFLEEVGFPVNKIMSSFVASNFPLFTVYLFVLLQSSIAVSDGEWDSDLYLLKQRNINQEGNKRYLTYGEKTRKLLLQGKELIIVIFRTIYRYWESVTEGAETPPYFVQLSMEVNLQPDEGIQPERIESGINKLLKIVHSMRCKDSTVNSLHSANQILVQSIERSSENPNVVLTVLEVVHVKEKPYANLTSLETSLTPAADVADEILTAQRCGVSKEVGFPYPIVSVIGGGKREIDLYAYVFCADFVVFSLVAMFYHSVIKNNSEFLEVYQLEDQFPIEFVFLLMILFFLIVLDRVIYLSSITTGKIMFYLFTLTLFTYSTIQFAWHMEPSHNHGGKLALRAIFLTKAISLALQATQIRYGISDKSNLYRKFLTKRVSQFNFFCFRLYRALPFLYELRCILDWSCTTTALTMYDWLKLEDIHASLFLVKCDVDLNRAKRQQGQRQTKMTKFCSGICLFFVLLCVIWAPMLMYSSGNPTNIANPIKDASVRIDLKINDGRLTLFETTICEKFTWDELDKSVDLDPQGYLTEYNEKDVQLICCQADASTLWMVPPVVQARFIQSLNSSMNIVFYWQFIRDRPKSKEVVKYELVVPNHDLPKTMDVMAVLNGTSERFSIHNVYPRYFRVTGSGDVRFLEKAVHIVSGDLVLNRGIPQWWSFHDMNASDVKGCRQLTGPMATIVSEETPQSILGETLSKFSIWGLYITFVLAVGRFIRLQCSDLRMRIPFENLPSCDRLLAICENIYIARAEGELEVEEVLYWILVKIYRSPHILLEYTKVE